MTKISQHQLDGLSVRCGLAHGLEQGLGLLGKTDVVHAQSRQCMLNHAGNLFKKISRQCRC